MFLYLFIIFMFVFSSSLEVRQITFTVWNWIDQPGFLLRIFSPPSLTLLSLLLPFLSSTLHPSPSPSPILHIYNSLVRMEILETTKNIWEFNYYLKKKSVLFFNPGIDPVVLQSRQLAIRGNEAASVGQYSVAVRLFTDAIRLDPNDHRFFGNRSYCYDQLGQHEKYVEILSCLFTYHIHVMLYTSTHTNAQTHTLRFACSHIPL